MSIVFVHCLCVYTVGAVCDVGPHAVGSSLLHSANQVSHKTLDVYQYPVIVPLAHDNQCMCMAYKRMHP